MNPFFTPIQQNTPFKNQISLSLSFSLFDSSSSLLVLMELIPGLPDDVARDCLVRVMYKQFPTVVSVCKGWRSELELPEFSRRRKNTCSSQRLIVMAQARIDQKEGSSAMKYGASPIYRLTLLELDTGDWCELPLIPEVSNGLPMFCRVVSVGSEIVVLGGMDPTSWEVSNSVFVFDFVSATWRRGADMPGVRRSFFGCASDSDRTVFVVGGHDDEKNALRSGMVYDVAKDEWAPLPDLARERDECKALFHDGKLHVIGGYCTEMQGRFEKTAEVFDVATWKWNGMQENFLAYAMCPRSCTSGNDQLYTCHGTDVLAFKDTTWQAVAKLPADVHNIAHVEALQGKLSVIGSAGFGEPYVGYEMDLKKYTWRKVQTPQQYSGHVQSGCYLEI
ncbi:F-box/kelch-repeat protein At1g80440 [Jatropha curcas]|uniref:F-box/kelch-repeat protein At1g80440 n=1 Tax=Jatropha curcas TaxID=180498 RepID=UPI00189354D2|nr:F-box/kelch-repeat protein At1g80440 [Jatropha curcas]